MAASTTSGKGTATPSRDELVVAALRFLDENGLQRFSVNALATEMGVYQSNLYRRITGRDELLSLIVDAIMSEVRVPETDDWRAWLSEWALEVRRAWHRHPQAAGLLHHGGPGARAAMEPVMGVLLRTFPAPVVGVAAQAFLAQVFGATLLTATAARPVEVPEGTDSYPNLVAFSSAQSTMLTPEEEYLRGVQILLDGLAGLTASGRTPPGP